MTIELDEQSYIVGVWFSWDSFTGNNWMACVIRDPENPEKYKGWSRFRYVRDENIFESADEKSWTAFNVKDQTTEDEIIKLMDSAQTGIEPGYPDKDRIIVKGSLEKLMELSKGKEWMHMKESENE